MKKYRLVLQEYEPKPPSELQRRQRERFAKAARETALELADSSLHGAERVMEVNRRISEKMKATG